ncbi:MAG: ATP-binding protein [Gemmatimonadota bacterium]
MRDAYPGSLEETILTEIVANSLDSGAGSIVVAPDPERATLTVIDDGRGMIRRELTRYHDLAASSKTRGRGIGFAGVGIKLGLLLADDVITETRRGKVHVATSWRLASRNRAPWKFIEPPGLVATRGTAVTLRLDNPLSPLLDSGFLAATLTTHFQPLFESVFDEMLTDVYTSGVVFVVARRMLLRDVASVQEAPITIHTGRKRKPSGIGYLARSAEPLPETQRGIAVSTLGKVIKRGWDWLGITPVDAERVHGLVEVPALAEALTLNKSDFVRTGARGALYLTYRKAIQEAISAQLAVWGDDQESESKRQPRTRPIERDIERVLGSMTHDFPLLSSLVERRGAGQRRLQLGTPSHPDDADSLVYESLRLDGNDSSEVPGASDASTIAATQPEEPATQPAEPREQSVAPNSGAVPGRKQRSATGKLGIEIRFESRPESDQLGRLIESIVWINDAHPAYQRAHASRSEGYHIALSVALALASLAVEPHAAHYFVTTFLTHWGAAAVNNVKTGRR